MISNFQKIRRDGKVIPEGMAGEQMIAAGWEPDKVLWMRWDYYGHPIEMASQFGFLSRIVPSREYLAVMEDTDATGDHAMLSVYLSNGTFRGTFPNIMDFPAREIPGYPPVEAHREAGEYVWFQTPKSPLPTAFAAVFKVFRTGATYRIDIDAATGSVLGIEEVH